MNTTVKSLIFFLSIMTLLVACSKKDDAGRVPKEPDNGSGFQQIGLWQRNDNRIYTIFVSDEDWSAMEEYAEGKPYKTGHTTSVLFFDNRDGTPDMTKYKGSMRDVMNRIYADGETAYWIARYDRFPSGEAIFKRYPAVE
jgi:hypothetical protein